VAAMPDLEYRIERLEDDAAKNKSAHKEFYSRFEDIGKEQVKTETTYANILEKLGSLEAKVDGLASKPARRWESVVATLIAALVAAAVAYFIGGGVG
jgi:chromosome segregation ATPase